MFEDPVVIQAHLKHPSLHGLALCLVAQLRKYDKTTVLGLKLRHQLNLRRLTRAEFWSRLQLIRTVEPITDEAFRIVEDAWKSQEDNSPHGDPWHVSFHASQFPGDLIGLSARSALSDDGLRPSRGGGGGGGGGGERRRRGDPSTAGPRDHGVRQGDRGHARAHLGAAGLLLSAPADSALQTGLSTPMRGLRAVSIRSCSRPGGTSPPGRDQDQVSEGHRPDADRSQGLT